MTFGKTPSPHHSSTTAWLELVVGCLGGLPMAGWRLEGIQSPFLPFRVLSNLPRVQSGLSTLSCSQTCPVRLPWGPGSWAAFPEKPAGEGCSQRADRHRTVLLGWMSLGCWNGADTQILSDSRSLGLRMSSALWAWPPLSLNRSLAYSVTHRTSTMVLPLVSSIQNGNRLLPCAPLASGTQG